MEGFIAIEPEEITENTFKMFRDDWALITAGTKEHHNFMTVGWGGFGVLWGNGKRVCFSFVHPKRYTYEFMEREKTFTLSFFDEGFKDMLMLCGTNSGRDIDKAAATGLTLVEIKPGVIGFQQAKLIIECNKIYYHDLDERQFLTDDIAKIYSGNIYHRMYIGEIQGCYLSVCHSDGDNRINSI